MASTSQLSPNCELSIEPQSAFSNKTHELPNFTNKSIDSTILNSPSSAHRLQALTRKQRTPLSNRPSIDPSTGLGSIDLADTPGVSGVLSSASSILYLSEIGSSVVPYSPSTSSVHRNSKHLSEVSSPRSSTPFGSASCTTANGGVPVGHSIAYYLHMPRLDAFLRLTHSTVRLAFTILPILWTLVLVSWIVYLRQVNLIADPLVRPPLDPIAREYPATVEYVVATCLTVLAVGASLFFAGIYVIKSHWAYSFEFVPTDDDFLEPEYETLQTSVPEVKVETRGVSFDNSESSSSGKQSDPPISVHVISDSEKAQLV